MESLKRIVIKEELVSLTGDYKKAIILNQFLYWTERVKDFDKFIKEEKERYEKDGKENNQQLLKGWIYKTAEELSEETMLGLSKSNIRLHIKYLIEQGWIDERVNPNFKWDKTMQYRVNILKIQKDLYKLGYALEGYSLNSITNEIKHEVNENSHENEVAENEDRSSKTEPREIQQNFDVDETEHRSSKIEPRDFKIEPPDFKIEPPGSKTEQQYQRLLTENTTDSIYSQSVNKEENRKENETERQTDEIKIQEIQKLISAMAYPCPIEEMIQNSIADIVKRDAEINNHDKKERSKYIDQLTDKKIIDFAIEKFLKLDKTKIKNPQGYFTTMLYTSIFEYAASKIVGQHQNKEFSEKNKFKNKFHNFDQKLKGYSEQELEKIAKKEFNKSINNLRE